MKKVIIGFRFVNSNVILKDHENHIRLAVKAASRNLFYRFGIQITCIEFDEETNQCIIYLLTDSEDEERYNWPRKLRGISAYLLKQWPDVYKPLRHGTRLFYYWHCSN